MDKELIESVSNGITFFGVITFIAGVVRYVISAEVVKTVKIHMKELQADLAETDRKIDKLMQIIISRK